MSISENAEEIARQDVCLTSQLSTDSHTISGIAIGEGDVTRGQSGVKKVWPKEALMSATDSLEGRPLVVDHNNTSRATVGKVSKTEYRDGVGVLYEAKLYDQDLAEKISNGLLEVSIRGHHGEVSEMEENEEGAKVVSELVFDNLSIVPRGAAPSNTVEIGPSNQITAAECAEMLAPEGAEEDVEDPDENAEEQPERAEANLSGSVHEPSYDGTTDKEWNKPSLEDFTDDSWEDLSDDEKSNIGSHFIFSVSGFPASTFGDMKLPVVEPSGELNTNGVESAEQMVGQTDGLSSDQKDRVKSILSDLSGGSDEEENTDDAANAADNDSEESDAEETEEASETDESENTASEEAGSGDAPDTSDSEDNKRDSEMTEEETEETNTVSVPESELSELREARDELESLREESESRSEQIEELREAVGDDLEELKERTEILDEVDQSKVEALRDKDDPVVMSGEKFATLEEQVDSIRTIYSERLAEESEILDAEDVEEKFSVEEMAEKLEDLLGEDYEEELSPNPRSQDADEEELEETGDETETEVDEEVQAKQEELAGKLFN